MLGSLSLATDTRYNFVTIFFPVIFICLTSFSQLYFGLEDCMILMKQYVSLTIAAIKMVKNLIYSDHSNGC